MLRILRNTDYPSRPWKNGGGTTRDIIASPPCASFDDFDWRLSLAQVDRDDFAARVHALGESQRWKSRAARCVENDLPRHRAAGVAEPTRQRSEHDGVPVVPLLPAAAMNVVSRHRARIMTRDAQRFGARSDENR